MSLVLKIEYKANLKRDYPRLILVAFFFFLVSGSYGQTAAYINALDSGRMYDISLIISSYAGFIMYIMSFYFIIIIMRAAKPKLDRILS